MFRKKIFWLVIALFTVFAVILAACGKKATTPQATVAVGKAVENPNPAKVADTVAVVTQVVQATPLPTITVPVIPTPTLPSPVQTRVSIAILVIDDFTVEIKDLNETPTPPSEFTDIITDCIYTANGEQGYASTGAQGYASTGAQGYASTGAWDNTTGGVFIPLDASGHAIPHGGLVYSNIYNDLNFKLGATDPITPTSLPPYTSKIDHWNVTDRYDIYLVPIDTSDYRTTIVTQHIVDSIDFLSKEYNIQRFVLNMSFVIMPCNLGYDSEGNYIGTDTLINDYLNFLKGKPELKTFHDMLTDLATGNYTDQTKRDSLLYGSTLGSVRILYVYDKVATNLKSDKNIPFSNDTLYKWLVNLPTTNPDLRVISVAAAGNYGNSYFDIPFAPAIWNEVVSVSASGWDPLQPNLWSVGFDPTVTYPYTKTTYSNTGEITLNGQFNQYIKDNLYYDYTNGKSKHLDNLYYFGTSFAAPRLSIEEAFYLLHDKHTNECAGSRPSSIPPLGYSRGYGPWLNLTIEEAIPQYCQNFRIPLDSLP